MPNPLGRAPAQPTPRLLSVGCVLFFCAAILAERAPAASPEDPVFVEFVLPREAKASKAAPKKKGEVSDVLLRMELLRELNAGYGFMGANNTMGAMDRGNGQTELAAALVCIHAPEPVAGYATVNTRVSGPAGVKATRGVKVTPVSDFRAFYQAIDYGTVLEKNHGRRYVKVRIKRSLLDEAVVRKQARAAGREEIVDKLLGQRESNDKDIDEDLADSALFGGRSRQGLKVGDRVNVTIGPKVFSAVVAAPPGAAHVRITLDKMKPVAAAVSDRRLKSRLSRMRSLTLKAPLRALKRDISAVPVVEREWKDDTGRFSVSATYVSHDDDAVKIKKADGRVLSVPLDRLCDADHAYLKSMETEIDKGPRTINGVPVPDDIPEEIRGLIPFD